MIRDALRGKICGFAIFVYAIFSQIHGVELQFETRLRDSETGEIKSLIKSLKPSEIGVVVMCPWSEHPCATAQVTSGDAWPVISEIIDEVRRIGVNIIWVPNGIYDPLDESAPGRKNVLDVELLCVQPSDFVNILSGENYAHDNCMCGPQLNYCDHSCNLFSFTLPGCLSIQKNDFSIWSVDELYSVCKARGIKLLVYVGCHTDMCVIGLARGGLMRMMKAGLDCVLVRDIVDPYLKYDPDVSGATPEAYTEKVVYDLETLGVQTIDLTGYMHKQGLWDSDWLAGKVRMAPWGNEERIVAFDKKLSVFLYTEPFYNYVKPGTVDIRYTLDGSEPTGSSQKYEVPIVLTKTTWIKTAPFIGNEQVSETSAGYFVKK